MAFMRGVLSRESTSTASGGGVRARGTRLEGGEGGGLTAAGGEMEIVDSGEGVEREGGVVGAERTGERVDGSDMGKRGLMGAFRDADGARMRRKLSRRM
jgi:hypothetical protein